MPIIVIKPYVDQKIDDLFDVLLQQDYFSDPDNAIDYCIKIRGFIKGLPYHKHRPTKNKQWGQYYATYKANRRTTWFITFDKEDGRLYVVKNIFNNYTKEYPAFIRGGK